MLMTLSEQRDQDHHDSDDINADDDDGDDDDDDGSWCNDMAGAGRQRVSAETCLPLLLLLLLAKLTLLLSSLP